MSRNKTKNCPRRLTAVDTVSVLVLSKLFLIALLDFQLCKEPNKMTTEGWVAKLDKKEHKNWVMVGCALNITKNGITPKIQREMETWYQSLISSPPLQSLAPCTCAPRAPKCATCVTWEAELQRHHRSARPKICWDNSDRKQWGFPTGAWEVAKVFMPTLGSRKTHVVSAEATDIGDILNLLEWCPFMKPSVSRKVLCSVREECRHHWAHAPNQELQDADVPTIFGHLNSLLSDPVFKADKAAHNASRDLQDLFHHGLVNVRESEVEAFHLLRQSLVADLTKCQDDVINLQDKVHQLDGEAKKFNKAIQKDLSQAEVKFTSTSEEQSDLIRKEINNLRRHLEARLKEVEAKFQDDLSSVHDKVGQMSNDISTISHAVDDINRRLNKRDDMSRDGNSADSSNTIQSNTVQRGPAEVCHTPSIPTSTMMKSQEEKCAHELACDFIYFNKFGKEAYRANTRAASTLRRIGREFETGCQHLLKNMCDKLDITPSTAEITFRSMADEIFSSGINWGRIVAVCCFAAEFAVRCSQHDIDIAVEDVVRWLSEYLCNRSITKWIKKSGGWDSFCEYFEHCDNERENVWRHANLYPTLGLCTLAAAFLYSKN